MKYVIVSLLSIVSICLNAQPGEGGRGPERNANSLLNQSFWQGRPTVQAVKAEVEKGNSPSAMTANSFDATMMAIAAGAPNETILYLLDQKGNEPNKLLHDARTYIFMAASKGNIEIIQYLIKKGAIVAMQDSHGSTPVLFAAQAGQQNTQVYDLLIKQGIVLKTELNHDGANALLLGVGSDSALLLTTYFQSKGLDIKSKDAAGNTAFDYAARSGNVKVMKLLLDKGLKATDNSILMAAQGGRGRSNGLEVFQFIESLGANPTATNKAGENVLHSLVRRPGQIEIIKYFLSKNVNVNQVAEDGNNVFMNAASANRDTATLALLFPLVKDINQTNKAGASALAQAVKGNSTEAIAYLLNHGANINTVDAKGNNLTYYLFESYSPRQSREFAPKLQLLKDKGLNLATQQKDGNTIYHLAVAKNDLPLLKSIKEEGVDINAKNKEGNTALHKAAMIAKDDKIMQYLLSIGAKKDIKTGFEETAYDLAKENEQLTKQKTSIDFLK